jgi:hypothetical protein
MSSIFELHASLTIGMFDLFTEPRLRMAIESILQGATSALLPERSHVLPITDNRFAFTTDIEPEASIPPDSGAVWLNADHMVRALALAGQVFYRWVPIPSQPLALTRNTSPPGGNFQP